MIKQFCSLVLLMVILSNCKHDAKTLHSDKDYVFFLHNRFLELYSINDSAPYYGRAEYPEILEAFTRDSFVVISEKRGPETDVKVYARKVIGEIDSLLKKGIPANHITVVGTSKGGYIAQYVSTYLANPEVNYVFIGCYQDSDLVWMPDIQFCGNILTIYESTDAYGVSAVARKQSSLLAISHFSEIELHTGLRHGFLYKALDAWLLPCKKWARRSYALKTDGKQ